MIIGGPILGAIVLIAALVVLADTLHKYANGEAGLLDVAFAALDCIPGMKGLTSLRGLAKGMKGLKAAGLKGMANGVRGLAKSGRDMITNGAKGAYNRLKSVIRSKGSDPVDMATGAMFLPQTDITLPGTLPLTFTRRVASDYRAGQWFGPSWSSTVDQRLEIDEQGVVFVTEDGMLLAYPHPMDASTSSLPESGPRWPIVRRDDGGYQIDDPVTGHSRSFGTPVEGVALLEQISDRNGNTIAFDHDEDGAPIAIRHSGGYHLKLAVEGGQVASLILVGGAKDDSDITIKRYGYTDGNLTEVVNSSGLPLKFTYDDRLRVVSWDDTNRSRYDYAYDEHDRCVFEGGAAGHITLTLGYDGTDPAWPGCRITTLTTAEGAVSRFAVNDRCQVVGEVDAMGHITRSEYDADHHMLSVTDQLGHVTRFENNEAGQPTSITYADGGTSRYTYSRQNKPTSITLADGTAWFRSYDGRGNCTAMTSPGGATTRYSYDAAGGLSSVTDSVGQTTHIRSDQAGLPVLSTNAEGYSTTAERDAFGRVVTSRDALGAETKLRWTVEGSIAHRTGPDGAEQSWQYDGEGNCVRHTDALGGITDFEYTHFELLTARTDSAGNRYSFEYDASLRMTKVVSPQAQVWAYEYDPAGRLVAETDFDGRRVDYGRDAAGHLLSRTAASGQTIHFARDVTGRTVAKTIDGAITRFEYDSIGRKVRATNPHCDIAWSRDPDGRTLTETVNGRTTSFAYDSAGRRTSRTTPSGAVTEYGYSSAGRRSPVTMNSSGHTWSFDFDPTGREVARRLDDSLTLRQAWDTVGRLTGQSLAHVDRVVQERSYSYRPDGYLVGIDDTQQGACHLTLDALGQVTSVQAHAWTETYAYDSVGNQSHASWPGHPSDGAASGERTYAGSRLTHAGTVSYEYDAAGRVVVRRKKRLSRKPDLWRYEWDAEDRLTSVVTPDGSTWRYLYDPHGRRIAKQRLSADSASAVEETHFTWDGNNMVEEVSDDPGLPDLVAVTWDYTGIRPVAQAERRISRATQREVDARFFAMVTDLAGAPTELVDTAGEIAWQARKTTWGLTAWKTGNTAYTPLRFPGQYFDAETGLHYNYHRHYDPDAGRYVTADPLGLAPALNPMSYVINPFSWADPLGLSPYPNQMPESLDAELADAARAGVRPVRPGDPDFDTIINSGQIKWAVNLDGELVVMPRNVPGVDELKHPVLTGGDDVLAAGHADVAGSQGGYFGVALDNDSGHYLPSNASLQVGRDAFERAGITFDDSAITRHAPD
ncbi:DUF6531 domain-containing protein [Streptomyces sp. NPDC046853]|uniref:DUF6531 domain-containing protein n=1 Tax=Streptomyces sp. NPDC046853 TaxID=3154920 RepID=UPI0033F0AAC3